MDCGAVNLENGSDVFKPINNKKHNSDLPVLAISQEHGAIPREQIDYNVSVTEKSLHSYKVVEMGDFIISLRSFEGGIEYSTWHGICSPAYIILRKKRDIVEQYYRYYFKTDKYIQDLNRELEGIRDGKMVSYSQFSSIAIPVPDTTEQRKTADCLTSLDELIAAEGKKLAHLQAHKKGLMQKLFPTEGEIIPELRLGDFSKPWERKKLRNVTDVRDGTHDSPKFHQIGHPLVTSKNLTESGLDLSNISLISTEDFVAINKRSKVDVGDIIFGMIGTIGNPIIIDRDDFAIKNVALIKHGGEIPNSFLLHLLKSEVFESYVRLENAGNTQKFLGLGKIRDFVFYAPCEKEMDEIGVFLSNMDKLISAQSENETTQKKPNARAIPIRTGGICVRRKHFSNLRELAKQMRDKLDGGKKYYLIFAHNGTGKTRLSGVFKNLVKKTDDTTGLKTEGALYYNAFTEDLFYWDNDIDSDTDMRLMFNKSSSFLGGLEGLDIENKIRELLIRYDNYSFSINFEEGYVAFSRRAKNVRNEEVTENNIKISRGEESIFIWCFFLAVADLAIGGIPEYSWVNYIYVDNPISSLDDNNVVAVACHLAQLLKKGEIKVLISTHHALFFNVICNELSKAETDVRYLGLNEENGKHFTRSIGCLI